MLILMPWRFGASSSPSNCKSPLHLLLISITALPPQRGLLLFPKTTTKKGSEAKTTLSSLPVQAQFLWLAPGCQSPCTLPLKWLSWSRCGAADSTCLHTGRRWWWDNTHRDPDSGKTSVTIRPHQEEVRDTSERHWTTMRTAFLKYYFLTWTETISRWQKMYVFWLSSHF